VDGFGSLSEIPLIVKPRVQGRSATVVDGSGSWQDRAVALPGLGLAEGAIEVMGTGSEPLLRVDYRGLSINF